jgi:hypothetical protein
VDEPVRKARVEDDLAPGGGRHELPLLVQRPADRRVHPAVDAEDPECRDGGANRDHAGGEEVELLPHPLQPEQHHAQETRLQEKGGQHLIGHERPDDRPGTVGKDRPVGAELIGHDDAGDDAHREGDGEDLQPIFEQVEVNVPARLQPQSFQDREVACEPDREGREDEVERDGEGELDARQQQCGLSVGHEAPPSLGSDIGMWRVIALLRVRAITCR